MLLLQEISTSMTSINTLNNSKTLSCLLNLLVYNPWTLKFRSQEINPIKEKILLKLQKWSHKSVNHLKNFNLSSKK